VTIAIWKKYVVWSHSFLKRRFRLRWCNYKISFQNPNNLLWSWVLLNQWVILRASWVKCLMRVFSWVWTWKKGLINSLQWQRELELVRLLSLSRIRSVISDAAVMRIQDYIESSNKYRYFRSIEVYTLTSKKQIAVHRPSNTLLRWLGLRKMRV
jgi:hypothetical protein